MKVGFEFNHPRVINEDKSPMRYRVTRIAQGIIYFRPTNGGGSEFIEEVKFEEWVKTGRVLRIERV